MIPKTKPRAPRHIVQAAALKEWRKDKTRGPMPDFYVLSVRGYYRDTMGKVGVNDRGIFDDAFFVVGPDTFVSFRGNVDPSYYKAGVSSLMTGWHKYKPGLHGVSRDRPGKKVSYPAFIPATPGKRLPVTRDGERGRSKRDGVANNIHRTSYNTTGSAGCQTLPPSDWTAFHALVTMELKRHGLKTFWNGLVEGPIV